jgi:WD40 repeat protein
MGREVEDQRPVFAVSPDGKTLAGIVGGDVLVWDRAARAPRALGAIPNWNKFSGGICFSPDGTQIAAARSRGAFFLAPVNGNAPLQRVPVKCNDEDVLAVFWQQPNRVVALWRRGLVAFDPTTGAESESARAFEGNVYNPPRGVAGGGKLFAQEYYYLIKTFDLATLSPVPERACDCRPDEPFVVSADGRVLAHARGHAVRLFDARTGAPLHPDLARAPLEPLAQLHISPDGARLLGGTDYSAYTLDLSDGRALAELENTSWSRPRFALSPDGRYAAGGRSKSDGPLVIEVRTGRAVSVETERNDRDTNKVIGFAGTNRVWLWTEETNTFTPAEIGTGRAGAAVPGFSEARAVAVAPDGRTLAASGHEGLAVRRLGADRGWEVLDTYEERKKAPQCKQANSYGTPIRFSPCGRWLLVSDPDAPDPGAPDDGLELWDIRNKPVRVGRFASVDPDGRIGSDGAFSPDGRFLATAVRARDGASELCVWEIASATEVYRFRPARGVAGCAFTPDGRRLVIAHYDTTLGVWDRSGVEARRMGTVSAGTEWQHLRNRDATRACAAVRLLVANPERALALLTPAYTPPDVALTNRLIAELGAGEFRVRERAERALGELGLRAESALGAAVARSDVPEVRARAAALLKALGPGAGRLTGERLRAVRAVEVLERIASPEAKALLATWATHPDGTLAAEARAARARLDTSGK